MSPNVLVLDDDVNILAAFRDFFDKEHCTMIAAATLEEAAKMMEGNHFDLLITDVRLKSSSGVTFFLNAKVIYPSLPVIVITGYPESIDDKTLKQIGADYLLIKPLELDRLRQAVRSCLQKRDLDVSHRSELSKHSRKEYQ